MSIHTLCFCPQITKLLGVLSDQDMAHTCICHCKLESPCVNETYAHGGGGGVHVIVEIIAGL